MSEWVGRRWFGEREEQGWRLSHHRSRCGEQSKGDGTETQEQLLFHGHVEFDASRRALVALREGGWLAADEIDGAKQVLSAAAWTYVAGFVAALGQLIYFFLASRR